MSALASSSTTPDGTASPPAAASHRVLVAEDNAISRMLIGHQLRMLGCEPVCTEDGERAAAAWRDGSFSMVLTDLQMPRIDGFGLAGIVRDGADRPRVPIVALTADGSPGEVEQCRAAGIDDCITKPITLEALQQVLEKWLGVVVTQEAP